ncbi:MAG: GNAT family N-acetyltransferase [Spirochaetes bacterium]|nr:GNAT family N-acetyltransferase [Spirochaetota bacterium]
MLLNTENLVVQQATAGDFDDLCRLLNASDLPTTDLQPEMLNHFVLVRDTAGLAGAAGLEPYGDAALVRSLCTRQGLRGQGLGRQLLTALVEQASRLKIRKLYLLTQTAGDFFAKHGFAPTDRATAPAGIRASQQFSGLCPASALFMAADLRSLLAGEAK